MTEKNRLRVRSPVVFFAFWIGVTWGCAESAWIVWRFRTVDLLQMMFLLLYSMVLYGICCAAVTWLWYFINAQLRKQISARMDERQALSLATGTVLSVYFTWALVGLHRPQLVWLVPGCILSGASVAWILDRSLFRIPLLQKRKMWMMADAALVMFVLFAFGFRSATGEARAANHQRPNVLLISIDTLRRDHLGCYGASGNLTPEIDALARESLLFDDAVAPVAVTGPSHVTMLTGLHPVHHRVFGNMTKLPDSIVTLPELLSRAGYRTAGIIGGYTLRDEVVEIGTRFDHYDDDLARWSMLPDVIFQLKIVRLIERATFIATGYELQRTERPGERVTTKSLEWLSKNRDIPFFLFVHYFDVHAPRPLLPPYEHLQMPLAKDVPIELRRQILSNPKQIEALKQFYKDEVHYVDSQIGRLLRGISDLGLLEKTIILFTADHGESLTEHEYYFEHALSLYEGTIRVPMMIRFPNRRLAGNRVAYAAHHIDITPTILDAMDIKVPLHFDGVSLLRPTESADTPRAQLGAIDRDVFRQDRRHFYVRRGGYKLLWFFDQPEKVTSQPTTELLFDLKADPGEEHNLAAAAPPVLLELRQLMRSWVDLHSGTRPTELPGEDVRERLRALGYL